MVRRNLARVFVKDSYLILNHSARLCLSALAAWQEFLHEVISRESNLKIEHRVLKGTVLVLFLGKCRVNDPFASRTSEPAHRLQLFWRSISFSLLSKLGGTCSASEGVCKRFLVDRAFSDRPDARSLAAQRRAKEHRSIFRLPRVELR